MVSSSPQVDSSGPKVSPKPLCRYASSTSLNCWYQAGWISASFIFLSYYLISYDKPIWNGPQQRSCYQQHKCVLYDIQRRFNCFPPPPPHSTEVCQSNRQHLLLQFCADVGTKAGKCLWWGSGQSSGDLQQAHCRGTFKARGGFSTKQGQSQLSNDHNEAFK